MCSQAPRPHPSLLYFGALCSFVPPASSLFSLGTREPSKVLEQRMAWMLLSREINLAAVLREDDGREQRRAWSGPEMRG